MREKKPVVVMHHEDEVREYREAETALSVAKRIYEGAKKKLRDVAGEVLVRTPWATQVKVWGPDGVDPVTVILPDPERTGNRKSVGEMTKALLAEIGIDESALETEVTYVLSGSWARWFEEALKNVEDPMPGYKRQETTRVKPEIIGKVRQMAAEFEAQGDDDRAAIARQILADILKAPTLK